MESAESFNALGPMPPAAWELVSLWSEVWDAPRFRGQERVQHAALSREAILPLLKLAASCVVALQEQLKGKTVQHGAYGASRELLVAAMDGGENGPRALADPHGRPGDFVRGLSKAAFMTGDGEYSEGLSESQLDQLLDELCTSQLEQAASLVRDPSATLRVAMEKLTTAVEEVLASPAEEGDLAAVAQRLMLVQRLERAAEDASTMLKDAGSSSTEVESSQAVETSESTMEPMEESGDVHNGHGRSDAEALRGGFPARPLAVAQATFKRRHRQQIRQRHPEMTFVWVRANEEARLRRLAQRGSVVDAQLGRTMKMDFEAPGLDEKHLVFYNDQDEIEDLQRKSEAFVQNLHETLGSEVTCCTGSG